MSRTQSVSKIAKDVTKKVGRRDAALSAIRVALEEVNRSDDDLETAKERAKSEIELRTAEIDSLGDQISDIEYELARNVKMRSALEAILGHSIKVGDGGA